MDSNESNEQLSLKRIKEELSISESDESLLDSFPNATSTPLVIPTINIQKCESPTVPETMTGQVTMDTEQLRTTIDEVISKRLDNNKNLSWRRSLK